MHGDYKYAAQLRAEEIAEQEFGCDFYDLPPERQAEIYERGLHGHVESLMDRADDLRKAERERG
jgi:hypothetical protein